jgi:hypothetical protein
VVHSENGVGSLSRDVAGLQLFLTSTVALESVQVARYITFIDVPYTSRHQCRSDIAPTLPDLRRLSLSLFLLHISSKLAYLMSLEAYRYGFYPPQSYKELRDTD